MDRGYENWDVFNAILANGWLGVTIPEVLGDQTIDKLSLPHINSNIGRMRRELVERYPELIARDAMDIALLTASDMNWSNQLEFFVVLERLAGIYKAFRNPQATLSHILERLKTKIAWSKSKWIPVLISRIMG
jgi:hypothetical protein